VAEGYFTTICCEKQQLKIKNQNAKIKMTEQK
jgi:hypothetical protein